MDSVIQFINEAKKTVTAGAGVIALALAQGLIPDPERGWAVSALAFLTAIGVYTAKNKPASAG